MSLELYTEWFYNYPELQPIIIFLLIFFGLNVIDIILKIVVKKFVKKTQFAWDDIIFNFLISFGLLFRFTLSLYLTVLYFDFDSKFMKAFGIVMYIYIGTSLIKALKEFISYFIKETLNLSKSMQAMAENMVGSLLWTIGGIFLLQNLGVNVSAVLGGLGVIGIAVAFALQSVLEDIFAFISIQLDKPFQVGDYIENSSLSGTIEKIGLKSTRILANTGEEIVVNNRSLMNSLVHNFGRMKERRIMEKIGVSYETTPKQLLWIKSHVSNLVTNTERVRFDRIHFSKFGDSALVMDLSYYITSNDYVVKMDVQESVNLAILKAFNKEKIEIAYPTQTIYMKK